MAGKKSHRKRLVDSIDYVFSEIVRMYKSDEAGNCYCVTCGSGGKRRDLQNGHFVSRRFYKHRRDPINCRPQCVWCNVFKKWCYVEYTLFMQKIIFKGDLVDFDYFREKSKDQVAYSEIELETLLSDFYILRQKLRRKKPYHEKKSSELLKTRFE